MFSDTTQISPCCANQGFSRSVVRMTLRSFVFVVNHNGSGVAIDGDRLSVLNSFGAVADSQHSRNSILAGNDGTVGEDTSHVGDKTHRVCEQLCPRRGR